MEKEHGPAQPGESAEGAYRHELIEEFREALKREDFEVEPDTKGIVVLSAAPSLQFKGDAEQREKNPENISRISFGVDLYKQLAAEKLHKTVEDITDEDLADASLPPFVLNGETEQLQPMKEIAVAIGIPEEKIHLVDCGKRGIGNTKTQFIETRKDPQFADAGHLTFITSSYHTSRVERTAAANIPEELDYDIIGVPLEEFSYSILTKIRGEVKRIVQYHAKGDITRYPRKK